MNPPSALGVRAADGADPDPRDHPALDGDGDDDGISLPRAAATGLVRGDSAVALVVALMVLIALGGTQTDLYSAVALNDDLSYYAATPAFGHGSGRARACASKSQSDDRAGEFFGALLMINAGSMLVASANELVFLFVGLELVSIPTYLLLYLSRRNPTTQEAATKYFFLSIFASALLLYGLAFLYGTTGISNLKALAYLIDRLPNIPQAQLGLLALVSRAGGSLLPGRGRARCISTRRTFIKARRS